MGGTPHCSTLSRFVERDGTFHQRSHQFLVLLFDATHRHRQHHTERKPHSHFHLFEPPDEVPLKSKTHIESRIDSFHRRTLLVIIPCITGPRNGRKDPTIYLQRNPLAQRSEDWCQATETRYFLFFPLTTFSLISFNASSNDVSFRAVGVRFIFLAFTSAHPLEKVYPGSRKSCPLPWMNVTAFGRDVAPPACAPERFSTQAWTLS